MIKFRDLGFQMDSSTHTFATLLAFGRKAAKDGILEYIQQIKEAQKNISVTLF